MIAPVLAFRTRSFEAGNAPLARLYVVVPRAPVAAALALYAVPTVTLAGDNAAGKVIVGAVIVMDNAEEVALKAVGVPESVTVKVRLE